jgi:transcriptional regulator with XRE-family HTH domain
MFLTSMAPSTPADPMLAAAVRRIRLDRGETQEDVAHNADLTVGAFGKIERGAINPTWTTVRKIAEAFELSLGELGDAVEAERG